MSTLSRLEFILCLNSSALLSQNGQLTHKSKSLHISTQKPPGFPFLRSIAANANFLFMLWMPKAISNSGMLLCCSQDGHTLWSKAISEGLPLHLILDSDHFPICTTVEPLIKQLRFTKFGTNGTVISRRSLPAIGGVLSSFAVEGKVGYLNTQNSILHGPGIAGTSLSSINNALEIPRIGGQIPRTAASSLHLLSSSLVVLDHYKAAYSKVGISGSMLAKGQIRHERFDAVLSKQDADSIERSSGTAPDGRKLAQSFSTCISFAVSNREGEIFLIPSPMNPKLLTAMNLHESMLIQATAQLELPQLPPSPETRLPVHYAASGRQIFAAYPSGDVAISSI